ncbi:hypothetical protein Tco_0437874 [Tanacetum coccineum]
MMRSAAKGTLVDAQTKKADVLSLMQSTLRGQEKEKWHCLSRWSKSARIAAEYKASCHWAVKYLEGVGTSFGAVVKCALVSWVRQKAVEEKLHESRLLTVLHAQSFLYRTAGARHIVDQITPLVLLLMTGLTLARHATEGAEAQPDYFLKPDVSQLQVPIFASPRDILNPFALEKEVPLKESLEAHAIRLAKKKGVKGYVSSCPLYGEALVEAGEDARYHVGSAPYKSLVTVSRCPQDIVITPPPTCLCVFQGGALIPYLGDFDLLAQPISIDHAFASILLGEVVYGNDKEFQSSTLPAGKGPAMSIPHLWTHPWPSVYG